MMRKLFKWEFIYFYKQLKWVVVGVLSLALLTYLFDLLKTEQATFGSIHQATWFLSIIGIIILPVYTYFAAITRFYKHVLKDEGYLTHTLPVNKSQILISKTGASYIVFLLALTISLLLGVWIKVIDVDFFLSLYESLGAQKTDMLIIIIVTLLSSFTGFLVFYAALSFGFSYNKNEWLMMILFLVVYYIVYQMISAIILVGVIIFVPNAFTDPTQLLKVYLPLGLLQAAAGIGVGVLCYFIAKYFLSKKLNLKNG